MIDINKPVTNPELVEIMNSFLMERSAENEAVLIERIFNANYLVPIILEGQIETGVLEKGSRISFKLITNSLDESFMSPPGYN